MARRRYHAELNAVRALVADGLAEVDAAAGEADHVLLAAARTRLRAVDGLLVAATASLAPWTRAAIGTAAVFGTVGAVAAGGRALGLPAGWVIACGLAVLIPMLPLIELATVRLARALDRRRLSSPAAGRRRPDPPARLPGRGRPGTVDREPADAKNPLAEVPDVLLRARVRLVSAILRQAGSRQWRVATLRFLAAQDRGRIGRLARADEQLCQSIDFLEIYLDGPGRGRP